MTTPPLLLLLLLLLGTARGASQDSGSTVSLRSLDRFRRLIPYMTFYFAQENIANDQSHMSRVPVFTSGKVPHYPGNLATLPPLQAYVMTPRPFTPARPKPVSLLQILYLLQHARKLPQSAGVSGQETLSQIVDILHRANRISPETEATLAKIFRDIPNYSKLKPAPVISVNGAAGIQSPVTTPRPFSPSGVLITRPAKVMFVSTPSPVHSTQPALEAVNVPRKLPKARPPVDIAHVTSARPVLVPDSANEVQGLDYVTKTVPPAQHEFPSYEYAPKLPQTFYGLKSHVQTYPDPHSTGSTPGTPGVDYPTYARIPETEFSCKNQRYKGFFGDPQTSCQVWHYCDLNGGQASFLCPNGTIFSQVALTCDWWYNVRCASTTQLYVLNERLYKYILPVTPSFPEDFTGPLVDHYLTLKFKEIELKNKEKEKEKEKSKDKDKDKQKN